MIFWSISWLASIPRFGSHKITFWCIIPPLIRIRETDVLFSPDIIISLFSLSKINSWWWLKDCIWSILISILRFNHVIIKLFSFLILSKINCWWWLKNGIWSILISIHWLYHIIIKLILIFSTTDLHKSWKINFLLVLILKRRLDIIFSWSITQIFFFVNKWC